MYQSSNPSDAEPLIWMKCAGLMAAVPKQNPTACAGPGTNLHLPEIWQVNDFTKLDVLRHFRNDPRLRRRGKAVILTVASATSYISGFFAGSSSPPLRRKSMSSRIVCLGSDAVIFASGVHPLDNFGLYETDRPHVETNRLGKRFGIDHALNGSLVQADAILDLGHAEKPLWPVWRRIRTWRELGGHKATHCCSWCQFNSS